MEQNLIAVFNGEINNKSQLLCNARELHAFLQSKQKFSDWIRNRIERYGFVENVDFIFHKVMKNNFDENRGRQSVEYHITLDMAKELAMVENNAMGRQIRRYFIACEEKLRENQALMLTPNQLQLLQTQITLTQRQTGMRYWQIYTAFNKHFGVSYYAYIPQNAFHQALDYLINMAMEQANKKGVGR